MKFDRDKMLDLNKVTQAVYARWRVIICTTLHVAMICQDYGWDKNPKLDFAPRYSLLAKIPALCAW